MAHPITTISQTINHRSLWPYESPVIGICDTFIAMTLDKSDGENHPCCILWKHTLMVVGQCVLRFVTMSLLILVAVPSRLPLFVTSGCN